jgi:hypothetical protein
MPVKRNVKFNRSEILSNKLLCQPSRVNIVNFSITCKQQKPILTPQARSTDTLRVVLFCTFVLLAIYFVGITNSSAEIVLAQMHNMTIPTSGPNSSVFPNKTTFSAIGQISSLIITVPKNDFNIAHAFNVILTGDWNLSVIKGKITNFVVTFLASPMDGTKPHMHQISNFKSTNKEPIELTSNGTSLINGTADIKINGQVIWKDAHISVIITNSRTFMLDPNDGDTDNHFGDQSVYGIVTRLII